MALHHLLSPTSPLPRRPLSLPFGLGSNVLLFYFVLGIFKHVSPQIRAHDIIANAVAAKVAFSAAHEVYLMPSCNATYDKSARQHIVPTVGKRLLERDEG